MTVVRARMHCHAELPSLPPVLHSPSITSAWRHPNCFCPNPSLSHSVENRSPSVPVAFFYPRARLTYRTQLKTSVIIILSAKEWQMCLPIQLLATSPRILQSVLAISPSSTNTWSWAPTCVKPNACGTLSILLSCIPTDWEKRGKKEDILQL